jgi:APA family basic amino acid/polyamine antiporter
VAAFTILLYYGIANIAALRLAAADKLYLKRVAVLGLISCVALAVSLPLITILTGLGLLVTGFVLRWLFRKLKDSSALNHQSVGE